LDNPLITGGNHGYAHKNFNESTNAEFEERS